MENISSLTWCPTVQKVKLSFIHPQLCRLRKEHSLSKPKTDFIHSVNNERGREQYSMTSESQSRGTRRIFGLEAVLYEVFSRNGFLTIDEIETSLHPDLVEFFIASFLKQKSRSQMIVTTHYDPLLETIGGLKEQVYKKCVEKMVEHMNYRVGKQMEIGVLLFDNHQETIAKSGNAASLLKCFPLKNRD